MALDEELAINLMQALHRSLPLVKKAPDLASYPTVLDDPNLPCILTWPANGSFYIKGDGWWNDTRTMLVIGYVQPLGQGDIPSRAVQAIRLHQAVRAAYVTAANVALQDPTTAIPYQITIESGPDNPHSDGGLQSDLSFGGKVYHGFLLRINVTIRKVN